MLLLQRILLSRVAFADHTTILFSLSASQPGYFAAVALSDQLTGRLAAQPGHFLLLASASRLGI